MKAIRISLEEIKEKEYSSEIISTIKEKIFPDNSGNGMPNKQHWFTKQISKLQSLFTWIFYLFSLFARYLDS